MLRQAMVPWKRISVLCAVAALALGVVAGTATSAPRADKTHVNLVLPSPSVAGFFLYYVAKDRGFFDKQGLDVSINTGDGSSQTAQLLAAGKADIIDNSSTDVLRGVQKGFHPVMWARTWYGEPVAVYVKAGSSIRTAADLKGKTVGVQDLTAAEAQVTRSLAGQVGLKDGKDFKLLAVGDAGQAVAAFERGDIDAMACGIRDAAIIQSKGLALRQLKGKHPSFIMGLWSNESWLKKNKQAAAAFLRATKMAYDYIGASPQKLLKWTKGYSESEVPPGAVGPALMKTVLQLRRPSEAGTKWGPIPPRTFQLVWSAGHANGELTLKGKPTAYYTNQFFAKK